MAEAAIVLCGGESKRMGRAKAWLPFGNELLLQRIVRIVGSVVELTIVVAAPGQVVPPLPKEVRLCRDEAKGRGPLQGLHAGLIEASAAGIDVAFLCSCDAPFLRPALVRRVLDRLELPFAVCVPFLDGRYHPLAAAYRTGVAEEVGQLLQTDRLRPVYLFDRVATRVLTEKDLADVDPERASFRNLNTPEDYRTALMTAGVPLPDWLET